VKRWRTVRNALLDLRYGKVLAGTIETPYEHLGAFDTTNSQYEDLPHLFAAAEIGPGDVIVDVGCGKGRVLNWLVRAYPENRLYGIELDPAVCADTARRLRRFGNVKVLCGDATELLPPEGTVFYLFNPFDESVMRRFVSALPEPARVVYYKSKFLEPFREDPTLVVSEIELPSGSHESALIRRRC